MLGGSLNSGHLTPSQMKINGIQINLNLQVSSLNFLLPSHFICVGLIETSKNHILISYCFLIGQKYKFKLYTVKTLKLIYYFHEVYIVICIINYSFFMFLKVFINFQQPCFNISCIFNLHLVFWFYLLLLLCNCVAWNLLATANLKINHISIFLKCQC